MLFGQRGWFVGLADAAPVGTPIRLAELLGAEFLQAFQAGRRFDDVMTGTFQYLAHSDARQMFVVDDQYLRHQNVPRSFRYFTIGK